MNRMCGNSRLLDDRQQRVSRDLAGQNCMKESRPFRRVTPEIFDDLSEDARIVVSILR